MELLESESVGNQIYCKIRRALAAPATASTNDAANFFNASAEEYYILIANGQSLSGTGLVCDYRLKRSAVGITLH